MTNLLCVMRAISSFKALLASRSALNSPRLNLSPADAATVSALRPRHVPKPSMDEQELSDLKRQNAQHAVQLLKERMQVLKSRAIGALPVPVLTGLKALQPERGAAPEVEPEVAPEVPSSSDSSGREYGEPPPQTAPPVLGIGVGKAGEWSFDHEITPNPPMVVADSPAAVDFNVYDRAFEEEIDRIKQAGGRPSVYMTWHLGDKDQFRSKEGESLDLLEERQDEELAGGDSSAKNKLKGMLKTDRFADFVSQTIKDTREKLNVKEET